MNKKTQSKRVCAKVGVGYAWHEDGARKDARWIALRRFVQACAKVGVDKFDKGLAQAGGSTSFPDEADAVVPKKPTHKSAVLVECTRLRGTAGAWLWGSIVEHIDRADVAIFDLAAPAKPPDTRHPGTAHNVLLELGYALKAKCSSRVFVISDKYDSTVVPSDLKGYAIGIVPTNIAATDQSLRNRLANVICEVLSEKTLSLKT
jgi:hypothetical protein